jgi:hypothetical protein
MAVRRWLIVVAGSVACVASFLVSIRLLAVLVILHFGYGTEVPLPRWIAQRTSPTFWIASVLIGGPLCLALSLVGAWRLRSYVKRSRQTQDVAF